MITYVPIISIISNFCPWHISPSPRHPASKMVFTVAADAHAAAPASAVIFPGPPCWKSARAASNNCRAEATGKMAVFWVGKLPKTLILKIYIRFKQIKMEIS